jgi:thiol-disulfide isomerase/thioredoxin
VVAIYYWATWCDHCKERMDSLNDVYAKWGGARGFDVIGVCLDKTPEAMQTFLKANPTKWAQIYDDSGRLANDMGVMTLPLMILVDQKGNVVSDNIYLEGLEPELQRLLGTTTAQGSSALPAK